MTNDSTHKRVDEAISQLSPNKRRDRSASEKVRLLQLKLYQKFKQQLELRKPNDEINRRAVYRKTAPYRCWMYRLR